MTQDFAGRKRPAAPRKSGAKQAASRPASPRAWFSAGFLAGVLSCGLGWLALQQPDPAPTPAAEAPSASSASAGSPRFDFYTLLPRQTAEVDVSEEDIQTARSEDHDQYLLQAGSFKLEKDADRRRASLILLGLDARVQEAVGDNGRWYRVYVGPFKSRSDLARARNVTAQHGIDTLLLKRPRPDQG